MEKKSGFKECPRCGLRNKPSAAQCDFCGWEFRDVSDEWISHVQVLEKLNKATESIVLDDEVSRRIESTIVRGGREVPPPISPKPEVPVPSGPVTKGDVVIAAEPEVKPERWPEKRTVTVPQPAPEDKEVKTFVETMIGEPVTAQAAAVVNVQATEPLGLPINLSEPMREEPEFVYVPGTSFLSKYYKIFLAAGAAVYIVTLALYSMAYLDVFLGWSLAIAGALLLTFGVSHIYDVRYASKSPDEPIIGEEMRHTGDEVVICPRCHEEVNEGDARCPSCGAAFSH